MFSPKFIITNQILSNIASIEASKEIIENAPLVPAWERRFREEAEVKMVYHGTHVEGNPLSRSVVEKVMASKSSDRRVRSRDIQEIINYRNVIKYINSYQIQNPKPQNQNNLEQANITEQTVLDIHRLSTEKTMPKDEVACYRTVNVKVLKLSEEDVAYQAPSPSDIEALVMEFINWVNSDGTARLHPVIKAGIIQCRLLKIHPFTQGNGRTARALATLSLYLDGYDIKRFFSLEEHYDQDVEGYYSALATLEEDEGDFTRWLEYFTVGLAEELTRVKQKILGLSRDQKLLQKIGGQMELNERQGKVLDFIETHGKIVNKDWRRLLPDVSDDTVLRDLKDLIKKGVLRKRGKTKAAYYEMR